MKSTINAHNLKVLNKNFKQSKFSNCKKNVVFPLKRNCLLKGVYKATITNGNDSKEYIGSTAVSFKIRYNQHIYSF